MLSSAPQMLGVLASGRGGNFEALARAARRGEIPPVAVLLCDRPGAPVLERAARLGIEALTPPAGERRTRLDDERPWIDALRARGVTLVLLAGFMRRLHAPFLAAFPGRILNVHPSLLPEFPGLDAIRRALESGARSTGVTVHLVDAELDHGPVVAQEAVAIRPDDTLASLEARIHQVEHRLYPAAVRRFLAAGTGGRGARPSAEVAHHG